MSDEAVYDKSISMEMGEAPFIDKEVLYVSDQNNGSYNGRIQFDSTVLSNSGRWLDYSDGVIEVPVVIAAQSSADVTAAMNAYVTGLKSGHFHLFDSIQVQYQNKTVIQSQSFSNFYTNYKVLSSWSQDDLAKYGAVTGVAPDSEASFAFLAGPDPRGNGISNNVPYELAATKTYTAAVPLQEANMGLRERLEKTAHPAGGYGAVPTLTTAAQLQRLGKAFSTNDAGAGAARIYYWVVLATIRLKDLHDMFDKMPLVRGAQFRFDIVYNASRTVITNTAIGTLMDQTTTTLLSGNTVTSMVCTAAAGGPSNAWVAAGDGTMTIETNIVATTSPAASASATMSACRLYVPAYTLSPAAEAQYLSLGTKRVVYKDLYMQPIQNVAAGGNFSQILTNGIINPKELVIVPFLTSTANDGVQEFQSLFDSAPGTTGPCIGLSSFNVQLSGRNIFQADISYDFNAFLNEVAKSGGLSGGQVTGLAAGLITEKMWSNGFRYYVVDISRRDAASDSVPLSVQVKGVLESSVNCDLYCFITYEREFEISLADGAVRTM